MARRRKNGTGTVRMRADGRWEGRVVIGYDDKGLPKTKNVLGKTKKECLEKLKVLQEESPRRFGSAGRICPSGIGWLSGTKPTASPS